MKIQAIQAGISLEDFWRMTPAEFQIHRLAHLATRREEWHRAAFGAAIVANCWASEGKGKTPFQLLGWREPRGTDGD